MRDDLLLYILISQQIKICDVRTPRVQVTGASAIACWPRAQSSIWAKPQRHIRRIQPKQRPTIERNNPSSSSQVSLCAAGRCVRAAVIYGLATMQLVYRTRPPTSVYLWLVAGVLRVKIHALASFLIVAISRRASASERW
jgi:hypothetical protein